MSGMYGRELGNQFGGAMRPMPAQQPKRPGGFMPLQNQYPTGGFTPLNANNSPELNSSQYNPWMQQSGMQSNSPGVMPRGRQRPLMKNTQTMYGMQPMSQQQHTLEPQYNDYAMRGAGNSITNAMRPFMGDTGADWARWGAPFAMGGLGTMFGGAPGGMIGSALGGAMFGNGNPYEDAADWGASSISPAYGAMSAGNKALGDNWYNPFRTQHSSNEGWDGGSWF